MGTFLGGNLQTSGGRIFLVRIGNGLTQGVCARLGGFHAKHLRTGSESSWHQRLRDLHTRISTGKQALGEG